MTQRFAFLAQKLFNTPIAILPGKAEIVMAMLAERVGIANIVRTTASAELDEAERFSSVNRDFDRGYDLIGDIARIEIKGTLVQENMCLRPSSGMTGYDCIRSNFMRALADPEVEAIVLDINSPGGEVAGCFDLADTIYAARGTKPIWAILSECAYSAAYALATAADRITVPRTGGTGSVGVVCMHVNMSKALTAAGLTVTLIHYGARKIDGAPELPLSDQALARLQDDIDTCGDLFVQTVARNRKMSVNNVRSTEAATFLGPRGVEVGFADAVMAPDAVFRELLNSL